ncbi:hypothetical protein, partial [Blautia faecis]|uniref:hypothetical protein n=1 Tax=Blautia faecis TaxID=871665 RepID=UPI001D06EC2D
KAGANTSIILGHFQKRLTVFKIKSKYLRLHSQKKSRNFFPEKFLLFFISDQFLSRPALFFG